MEAGARIFVAGEETLIGAAIVRALRRAARFEVVDAGEIDLADPGEVEWRFRHDRPDYVFMAAGDAGGILANTRHPGSLMLDNLQAAASVIGAATAAGVGKLLYVASACVYPRDCPQPMREESLLAGPLEPTNEAYALAKLAGLVLCRAWQAERGCRFVGVIPANAFGPGDELDPEKAHVVAALMRRMHEAKARDLPEVEVWGTGRPRRDFIFVDDLADACLFLMERYEGPAPINAGTGNGITIADAAAAIKEAVGYRGRIEFDAEKPDGMPVKVLDASKLAALGWRPRTSFADGVRATYEWFLSMVERQ